MEDPGHNFAVAGGKLITDLKVVELKAELEARGLNKYGNKRELLERLRAYLAAEHETSTSKPQGDTRSVEVPNPWLHQEANLENDFIREYLQSQQALFRQQIAPTTPAPVSAAEPHSVPPAPALSLALQPHVGKKRGRKKKKKNKVASEEHKVLCSSENLSSVTATASPPVVQHSHLRFKLKASGCESAEASSSSWCGDDGGLAQRPSRSSARTSRALSRVSLEDEDSTPPLTAATSPSVSPPRTSSSLPILPPMQRASSSLQHVSSSPPLASSSLTLKINRGDNPDVFDASSKHHKKKHKKHSKVKVARVPSLKIKFNESSSSAEGSGTHHGLSEVPGSIPEPCSEVLPLIVSPCSASPQNSEVSSSIQDLGGGDHNLSPAATTAIMSPKSFDSLSDSKNAGDKQPYDAVETPRSSSQWRKSKRLIADLSEKATRRVSARERGGLGGGRHAEQQSPDTSERSGASSADDVGAVQQTVRLSGMKSDTVLRKFDGLRVQLHRDSVPLYAEGAGLVSQKGSGGARQLQAQRELKEREEKEKQEKRERDLKEKQERQLREIREREMKQKQENELKEERERELREEHERKVREEREREVREKNKRELWEKRERELKEKRERELKEQLERELMAKRERELKEKKEMELREARDRELKMKQEHEMRERRERELRDKQERVLQKERELAEKREQELKEMREAELHKQRKLEEEKQERELLAKRALELREQHDRAIKEERERARRQLELRRQEEEAAKQKQETPPSSSKVSVSGALVPGKTPKKSRASRAKKVAPVPAVVQHQPQPPVVWQQPPSQVIEGNLTLQKEVHVPNSLDLIVSQVTCGLTEESVPRSRPLTSSLSAFTSACDSSASTDEPKIQFVPLITSPDHSNLVSLTPVSESSLFETPLLKVKSNLLANERSPLKIDIPEAPLLKMRSNLTTSEPVVDESSVPSEDLTSRLLPSTSAIADVTLPSFLAPSPVVSPRRSSRESPNKNFGSPSPSNADDLSLASEVQDATYYLVKELQEQDSSYGHRRRSLDEISSPECTSTTVYTSSLTSPVQSPRFLSPERLTSPLPSVSRALPETPGATIGASLVVHPHSVTMATSLVGASVTSASVIAPLAPINEGLSPPSRSVGRGVSVRSISSLLEPSSSSAEKSLSSVNMNATVDSNGKSHSHATLAQAATSGNIRTVADNPSVAEQVSLTAGNVEQETSLSATSTDLCMVVTSDAQIGASDAIVSTPVSVAGLVTTTTECMNFTKTSDVLSRATDSPSAAPDSFSFDKTTSTEKSPRSDTAPQSEILGKLALNFGNLVSPIMKPLVNIKNASSTNKKLVSVVASEPQLDAQQRSLGRTLVDIVTTTASGVDLLKSADFLSDDMNAADVISSKVTTSSEEEKFKNSESVPILSKSPCENRICFKDSSVVSDGRTQFVKPSELHRKAPVGDTAEKIPRFEQDTPIIDTSEDSGNLKQQVTRRAVESVREASPRDGGGVTAGLGVVPLASGETGDAGRSAHQLQPSSDDSYLERNLTSPRAVENLPEVKDGKHAGEKLDELMAKGNTEDVSGKVSVHFNLFEVGSSLTSATFSGVETSEERVNKIKKSDVECETGSSVSEKTQEEKQPNVECKTRSDVTKKVHGDDITDSDAILTSKNSLPAETSAVLSKKDFEKSTVNLKEVTETTVLSKKDFEESTALSKVVILAPDSEDINLHTIMSAQKIPCSKDTPCSIEEVSSPTIVTRTSLSDVQFSQASSGSGNEKEKPGRPSMRGSESLRSSLGSAKKGHTGFSVADLLQKTDPQSMSVSSLISLPDLSIPTVSSSKTSSSVALSTIISSFPASSSISSTSRSIVTHVSKTPCASVTPTDVITSKQTSQERGISDVAPAVAISNIQLTSTIYRNSSISSERRLSTDITTATESDSQSLLVQTTESHVDATPHSKTVTSPHPVRLSSASSLSPASANAGSSATQLPLTLSLPVPPKTESLLKAPSTQISCTRATSNFPSEVITTSAICTMPPTPLSLHTTPSTTKSNSTSSLAGPSALVTLNTTCAVTATSVKPFVLTAPTTTPSSTHTTQSISTTVVTQPISTTRTTLTIPTTTTTHSNSAKFISTTPTTNSISTTPTTSSISTTPTTSSISTTPTTSSISTTPTTSSVSTTPTTSSVSTTPTTSSVSTTPTTSSVSTTPTTSSVSTTPTTSSIATTPTTSSIATTPTTSSISTTPTTSSIATTPTTSSIATTPTTSSIATTPTTSSIATTPTTSSIATTPTTSSIATTPTTSSIATTPTTSSIATTPTTSSIAKTPTTSSISTTPTTSSVSTTPTTSSVSTTPTTSSVSTTPTTSSVSTTPTTSSVSTTPTTSSVSTTPTTSSIATTPTTSSIATTPTTSSIATTLTTSSNSTTPTTSSLSPSSTTSSISSTSTTQSVTTPTSHTISATPLSSHSISSIRAVTPAGGSTIRSIFSPTSLGGQVVPCFHPVELSPSTSVPSPASTVSFTTCVSTSSTSKTACFAYMTASSDHDPARGNLVITSTTVSPTRLCSSASHTAISSAVQKISTSCFSIPTVSSSVSSPAVASSSNSSPQLLSLSDIPLPSSARPSSFIPLDVSLIPLPSLSSIPLTTPASVPSPPLPPSSSTPVSSSLSLLSPKLTSLEALKTAFSGALSGKTSCILAGKDVSTCKRGNNSGSTTTGTAASTFTAAPTVANTTKDVCSHKSLVTTVSVSALSLPESKEDVKSLEYSTDKPEPFAFLSKTSPSVTRSSDLPKPRVPYSMVIGRPANKIVFTPLKLSQKFTSTVQSSSFSTSVPIATTLTAAVSTASTADVVTVTSAAVVIEHVPATATALSTSVVAPRKSRWDMRGSNRGITSAAPNANSASPTARDSQLVSSSSLIDADGTSESQETKKDILVSKHESSIAPISRVSSSLSTHPEGSKSIVSSSSAGQGLAATDTKYWRTISSDSTSVTPSDAKVSTGLRSPREEEIYGVKTSKTVDMHSTVSPILTEDAENSFNESKQSPVSKTQFSPRRCEPEGEVGADNSLQTSYLDSSPSSSLDKDSPPPLEHVTAVARPAASACWSNEENALSENFINMGRTTRRKTSATDSENTATTRRSSRHSSKSAATVAASSPPPTPHPKTDEVKSPEKSTKHVDLVKNGDRAPEDSGDLHHEVENKSNNFKDDRSVGKHENDKALDDQGEQRPSMRARSRSRSVEVNKIAPGVRRSRRLSRGSSVEPSDDEDGLKGEQTSKSGGETGLQTVLEESESPEKRRSIGEAASHENRSVDAGKEREKMSPSPQPESLMKEGVAEKTTSVCLENAQEDGSFTNTDADNRQDNSGEDETDLYSLPASKVNRERDPKPNEDADQTRGADPSDMSDRKRSSHRKDEDQNDKPDDGDAEKVDDGDGVDAVKLTLETGETLDKFDDSDEEEIVPASAPAKRRSPEKKRRSRSPHKRRRSSSSSSSESSSRRRRQRRRDEVSSSKTAKKGDDGSSHKSSSKKSSHRDAEFSSPVKNGSDKQLSESRRRSPGSASKKKHSPIVLRGLAEQTDDQDDRRAAKHSRKSSSSHRQQSEERDDTVKEEEPVDDFDYSSFKSTRRVSLSKKLRDPDNDKAKITAAAATVSLKSSEPSIELSSQSLKGLLPEVHPVPESELKLDENEDDQGQGEEKKKNLGSLSDSELRERKLLLQKKLQGLEEKERQEKKKKQSSKDGEKVSKKTSVKEDVNFSDPEEEERALRKAAQESMRTKLAKKEELARRLDREDDNLLPEKKKVKKDRDVREASPFPKKTKEGREVRVVEGPAVVVRKTPSIAPARNPTSCVVIIRNLTRPFTLRQLQTLLQRTGRIVQPDGFWVDNVKSVCVARFENEDQAEETRMHLHGIQWPSSNPKTLFVDFTSQEDLERRLKESGAPVLPQPQDQLRRKASAATVREWDRVKLGERSPGEREREKELQKRRREEGDIGSEGEGIKRGEQRGEGRGRGRSRDWDDERHDRDRKMGKKEATSAPPEKPTPKSLDDLFNKTKAKPSIYWLPLNKEQIAEKEAMRRKLMAENEKQLAALKLKHEKEREEREKQRQERDKQREAEKKERASAAAKKKKSRSRSRSRSRKRSPKRSSRSRRRSRS